MLSSSWAPDIRKVTLKRNVPRERRHACAPSACGHCVSTRGWFLRRRLAATCPESGQGKTQKIADFFSFWKMTRHTRVPSTASTSKLPVCRGCTAVFARGPASRAVSARGVPNEHGTLRARMSCCHDGTGFLFVDVNRVHLVTSTPCAKWASPHVFLECGVLVAASLCAVLLGRRLVQVLLSAVQRELSRGSPSAGPRARCTKPPANERDDAERYAFLSDMTREKATSQWPHPVSAVHLRFTAVYVRCWFCLGSCRRLASQTASELPRKSSTSSKVC